MKDLVERVIRIQHDTDEIMKDASRILSEEIGTQVLAIREWGVHIADANWVKDQPGASVVRRNDSFFPLEARCDIDGVTFFALLNEEETA